MYMKSVISTSKAKATMVGTESMTTHTAGIDTSHLTRFTVLLVLRTQHYMWTKLDMVRTAKYSRQSFCCWQQNNRHYLGILKSSNMYNVCVWNGHREQVSMFFFLGWHFVICMNLWCWNWWLKPQLKVICPLASQHC